MQRAVILQSLEFAGPLTASELTQLLSQGPAICVSYAIWLWCFYCGRGSELHCPCGHSRDCRKGLAVASFRLSIDYCDNRAFCQRANNALTRTA